MRIKADTRKPEDATRSASTRIVDRDSPAFYQRAPRTGFTVEEIAATAGNQAAITFAERLSGESRTSRTTPPVRRSRQRVDRQVSVRPLATTSDAGAVVRRMRAHDYRDRRIEALARTNLAEVQAAQLQLNNTIDVDLGAGQTELNLQTAAPVRAELRNALAAAGIADPGNILSGGYQLAVGTHRIRIWASPATGAPLLTFDVRVNPPAGAAIDAAQADANWTQMVNNLTFEQATSRPFREQHVVAPVVEGSEEQTLLKVAIGRQKASSLVQLTETVKANIIAEMKTKLLAGTASNKLTYTTADYYPILDIDPNADTASMFDAQFRYALFHNGVLGLWQISHFEGFVNHQNQKTIANISGSGRGALHDEGQPLTFHAPANNSNSQRDATVRIEVDSTDALRSLTVRIDANDQHHKEEGRWKPADRQSGTGVLPERWAYDWHVPRLALTGRYLIRAEGRTPNNRRTRIKTRNINVV